MNQDFHASRAVNANRVFRIGGTGAKEEWARGGDDTVNRCLDLIEEIFDLSDEDIMDREDYIKECKRCNVFD